MTTASDILNSLESALMALDPPHVRLVQGASDFVAVKNWLHDKRAEIADTIMVKLTEEECKLANEVGAAMAPAPVRISPEVRRVLLDAMLSAEDDVWNDSSDAEIVRARAFVEALP